MSWSLSTTSSQENQSRPPTLTLAGGAITPLVSVSWRVPLEGHVESIHEEEATPTNDLDDEIEGDAGALPRLRVEQLKARHQELEEA